MKNFKKALIAVFVAAFMFQTDIYAKQMAPVTSKTVTSAKPVETTDTESVVTIERKKLEAALIDTEKIKTTATAAINKVREQLAKGDITQLQAAKKIGKENNKIDRANQYLEELTRKAVQKVENADAEQSYMNQFVAGAYGVGQRIVAPFKAGYGYTEQEKDVARAIIAELRKQLDIINREYATSMKTAISTEEKMGLMDDYNQIKQEFEDEIYQQQLITGDVMSTNRKLFWGAVGLAGTVAGGLFAKHYLGAEIPEVQVPVKIEIPVKIDSVKQPAISKAKTFPEALEVLGTNIVGGVQAAGAAIGESLDKEDVYREKTGEELQQLLEGIKNKAKEFGEQTAEERKIVGQKAEELARKGISKLGEAAEKVGEYIEERREKIAKEFAQAGEAIIAHKAAERKLDETTLAMEEMYNKEQEELAQVGKAMIVNKEEERKLNDATLAMEEMYNKEQEELAQAGKAMIATKKVEQKLDEATLAMEEMYNK
jgi:hypothetical protein